VHYEKFITLFIAIYDRKQQTLNYLNAGHQPAILKNGGDYELLNKGCTVLGMFDELPQVESGSLQIKPQSLLLSFTDGLSELEDEKGEQIEVEGLIKIVKKAKDLNGLKKDLIARIDQLKANSGISDDITFLALAFLP
jgi:sigma-B regulation protein RsbU (phosphoserine phosphatase)